MNTVEFRRLADYIETNKCHIFNMGTWVQLFDKTSRDDMHFAQKYVQELGQVLPENFCGTAGCIAGHYAFMHGQMDHTYGETVRSMAAKGLDLRENFEELIVFAPWNARDTGITQDTKITKEHAVRFLRLCADEMRIDPSFWVLTQDGPG